MNKVGRLSLLGLIIFFFFIPLASAATGDLQVTCEPGVRIFVDNVFKGVSKESEGGLFIPDLTSGPHSVKVIKKGFDPFEKPVVIKEFEAVEVVVKFAQSPEKVVPLSPVLESIEVTARVGALVLLSAPRGAFVFIDGEKKSGITDMRIENVRIGQHKISFQRDSLALSGTYAVEPDKTLELKADFKNNVIINISELKRSALEKEKAGQEENEPKKAAETGQPQVKEQDAGLKPRSVAIPEPPKIIVAKKDPTAQRPAISEAAKPYGELFIELIISRDTSTVSCRDTLLAKFPDQGVPPDRLLDARFLDARGAGDAVKYTTDSGGRSVSLQSVIAPQEGRLTRTSTLQLNVKEGDYTMAISKKRWLVDYYSEHKIAEKAALENITIKKGERLRVTIRYSPDRDNNFNHSIDRAYEAVGSKFYQDIDTLLKNKR
jgi:hypothetical protein